MGILNINARPIRTVLNKGFVSEDLRGEHGNHPTIDNAIKE